MRKPSFSNWQGFGFRSQFGSGVDFGKYVTEWSDTREYDLATHQYLKRAGGENEDMGRAPHLCSVVLSFAGPTWYKDFLALVAELDKSPKGVLTHPLFGQMRAACRGYHDAKMNVEQAADLYVVPLAFIEDNLDSTISSPQSQGPGAQVQLVNAYASTTTTATAKYTTSSSAVSSYTSAATAYATAAMAAVLSGKADYTLPSQLGGLMTMAMAARDAVRADPADTTDAPRYSAVVAIELLLDACRQLDRSVALLRPTLVVYVVPYRVSLTKLAHQFYGKDGLARIPEIQLNNPGKIPDPHGIAPNTQLRMAPATV